MKIIRFLIGVVLAFSCASLNIVPLIGDAHFTNAPDVLSSGSAVTEGSDRDLSSSSSSSSSSTWYTDRKVPQTETSGSLPLTDGKDKEPEKTEDVESNSSTTKKAPPSTSKEKPTTPTTEGTTAPIPPSTTKPPKQTTPKTESTSKTVVPDTSIPEKAPETEPDVDIPDTPDTSVTSPVTEPEPEPEPEPEKYERTPIREEIRGVWVATVYRLDYPSDKNLSSEALKNELRELVDTVESLGMNAIFFQVRPTGDALYHSDIFPSSHWVTGTQGAAFPDDIDILQYLLEYAHSKNIAVHAWINPYRVTNTSSMVLSDNNPAKMNTDLTMKVDGNIYYNPALPEVIDLVCRGIAEIVENYDVDGIIFDDYFYPSSKAFKNADPKDDIDYETYLKYKGNFDNIADWRRNNVNTLVRSAFETIKKIDPDCLFGISPAGIWNNKSEEFPTGSDTNGSCAYQSIFCDALAWANGKYVDYISPQLYWQTTKKNASFTVLAIWWQNALAPSGTPLVISMSANNMPVSQTFEQINIAREQNNYGGYIMYRSALLFEAKETTDVIKELGAYYKKEEDPLT